MKNLKRILAFIFATVLLLSCSVAFAGCDSNEPADDSDQDSTTSVTEVETEPPLIYEEALYNYFVENMGATSNFGFDDCEMTTVEFWCPNWEASSTNNCIATLHFVDNQGKNLPLVVHQFPLTEDKIEAYIANWPQEAVHITTIDATKIILIDLAKLETKDKTELLQMVYDEYLNEYGETPTYSCEFYEEALHIFFMKVGRYPSDFGIDSCEIREIGFLPHGLSSSLRPTGCAGILYFWDDTTAKTLSTFGIPLTSYEIEAFLAKWPQEAITIYSEYDFTIDTTKLSKEKKTELLKMFYNAFVKENPFVLEELNIQPY